MIRENELLMRQHNALIDSVGEASCLPMVRQDAAPTSCGKSMYLIARAITLMAKAIGYPEAVPPEAESFVFVIDGRKIEAQVRGGRLIVSCVLVEAKDGAAEPAAGRDAARRASAPYLATLAAGRLMRETATIAWDAEREAVVLWDAWEKAKSKGQGEERSVRAFVEAYLNSLDWWMDRVMGANTATVPRVSEMRIVP